MVSKEEIEHVAKLMRIEINDPTIYEQIDKMIGYFDILDTAGVESEEISMREISISSLREDRYIPFNERLIEKLKHYKEIYFRAPKMI
jgi:aspartyl-tRNA(Asn)/glutamyl-tRNA(Gln) amidotransferase subunit C